MPKTNGQNSALEPHDKLINSCFNADTALRALHILEENDDEWSKMQAKNMRRSSPLSLACCWKMLMNARDFGSVEQALVQEYRFVYRSMSMGDVLEGDARFDHRQGWQT